MLEKPLLRNEESVAYTARVEEGTHATGSFLYCVEVMPSASRWKLDATTQLQQSLRGSALEADVGVCGLEILDRSVGDSELVGS